MLYLSMRFSLHKYLYLSRREERSFQLVLILILLVSAFRLYLSVREPEYLEMSEQERLQTEFFIESLREMEKKQPYREEKRKSEQKEIVLFSFDPNLAGENELLRTGLDTWVVSNIVKYRKAGGKFRSEADFRKIYGLEESEFQRLKPWLKFPESPEEESLSYTEYVAKNGDFDEVAGERDGNADERIIAFRYPVEVNSADFNDLLQSGLSDAKLAGRIIRYREILGGYSSISQLEEVYGMSSEKLDSLKMCFIADTNMIKKLDAGISSYSALLRHPYIDKTLVSVIFEMRDFYGDSLGLEHLRENSMISDSLWDRLSPYFRK